MTEMSIIMLSEEYQQFLVRNRTGKGKKKKKSLFQIYNSPHVNVYVDISFLSKAEIDFV